MNYYTYTFSICKTCYPKVIEQLANGVYYQDDMLGCNNYNGPHNNTPLVFACFAKVTPQRSKWKFTNVSRRKLIQEIRRQVEN